MNPVDSLWLLICTMLVMLMQAGFCCLESGLVRSKNSINVAMKNLSDLVIAGGIFWVMGYALIFGPSQSGLFGAPGTQPGNGDDPGQQLQFLYQLMFCSTAVTLISGAVAERMSLKAYFLVAILVSGVLYPFFAHWAWNVGSETSPAGWLHTLGFIDFAGATVVHSIGGWAALALVLLLGPRAGRFSGAQGDIPGHHIPLATLGVLFLWIGWFGFNGGSIGTFNDEVPLVLINTFLGSIAGVLISGVISLYWHRQLRVNLILNGLLAGLVSITAACNIITPLESLALGAGGGLVAALVSRALVAHKVDDVIDAFSVHAAAGLWGTLGVALFGDVGAFGADVSRIEQLYLQAIGAGVCMIWAFGITYVVFSIIKIWLPMRVSPEAEREGLNIAAHGATTEMVDLLVGMESHRQTGDFTKHIPVEPHTEVGQIARQYNQVLDRVLEETANAQELALAAKASQKMAEDAQLELEDKLTELQAFNRLSVGRELRMVELKKEINELAASRGEDARYDLDFAELEDKNQDTGDAS